MAVNKISLAIQEKIERKKVIFKTDNKIATCYSLNYKEKIYAQGDENSRKKSASFRDCSN